MNTARAIRVLGPIDLKNLWRDSFLRWMTVLALSMGLLMRWGVPALATRIQAEYQFDLMPFYPMVMSFALVLMPTMAGLLIGFLLLDQKDDGTLSALQVTPLGLKGYLVWRIASPMLLSTALTVLVMALANLIPIDPLALLVMALAVSPLAPVFALFLAGFARNKVQGMALTKVNGVFTMPPVVAWFVHAPWQLAFGLVPTYWPCKALWRYAEGRSDYVLYLLVGVIYLVAILVPLLRRFLKVMVR